MYVGRRFISLIELRVGRTVDAHIVYVHVPNPNSNLNPYCKLFKGTLSLRSQSQDTQEKLDIIDLQHETYGPLLKFSYFLFI